MWDQETQCSLHILINTERQEVAERWVAALLQPGKLSRVLISPCRYKAIICFITYLSCHCHQTPDRCNLGRGGLILVHSFKGPSSRSFCPTCLRRALWKQDHVAGKLFTRLCLRSTEGNAGEGQLNISKDTPPLTSFL